METSERIVESYVRHVKGWMTISNVKCKQNKEIDILAIDPLSNKKYHIEVSVHITTPFQKLTTNEIERGKGDEAKRRRTLKFFVEDKFNDTNILEKLKDYGFSEDYGKVIVTYDVEESEEMKQALEENKIAIWKIHDLIKEIMENVDSKYYSDDILRTIQLISQIESKK